jgi:Transposase DDE domain
LSLNPISKHRTAPLAVTAQKTSRDAKTVHLRDPRLASYLSCRLRLGLHPGYGVSQRIRKRIEEVFGWAKTSGGMRKTRHRGEDRVGWMFTLTATAYNLVRLPKLLATA